jgi:dTDP-glucose 4,6-dehydratase
MSGKQVLVTGGAGCIGSNIVEELVRRGKKITVIDNFSAGLMRNLKPFMKNVRLVRGDIRDPKAVDRAMKGVSVVIHQAAIRSVPKSVNNPLLSHEVNTTGTLTLLNAAVKHGVKRFVYASSSSVYGGVKKFPMHEDDSLKPMSPYGVSKLCGEQYCHAFHEIHGLHTVALRYFNVYGPRQNPESLYSLVVPAFIDKVRRGERPVIDGTGKQSRDFTYVKDVARANYLAAFEAPRAAGKSFNIAGGRDTSILEILNLVAKHMGRRTDPIFGPRRKGDPMRTFADISAAKRDLGWKPTMKLDDGIRETVQWFEANKPERL